METSSQPLHESQDVQEQPAVSLQPDALWDIIGLLLTAAGVLSILSLLSIAPGALTNRWASFLTFFFGWGGYLLALISTFGGLALLVSRTHRMEGIPLRRLFGVEILFLSLLGLAHLAVSWQDSYLLATQGQGGGVIGWALASILSTHLGLWGGLLLLMGLLGLGIILALDISTNQIQEWLEERADRSMEAAERLRTLRLPEETIPVAPSGTRRADGVSPAGEDPPPALTSDSPPAALSSAPATATPPARSIRKPEPGRTLSAPAPPATNKPRQRNRSRRRKLKPPSLSLLRRAKDQKFSAADARAKAKLIEDTLASFGVPARVVEINSGPAITQFGVKPGFVERRDRSGNVTKRKVKVSKITGLADDLALALAAYSVRMEAPVPGRPVVGIEVPNSDIALVSLRDVMESRAFRRIKSPLRIALGRNVSGTPVAADMAAMPHLLIAGATGSGKSVCINSIIAALLFKHTPETLQLLMIDPKMVELVNFNGIPHLISPVVVDLEQVIGALTWAMNEMEDRYKRFAKLGVRNLATYNQKMTRQKEETLPNIVILIDELADLMMSAPEAVERIVCRIAQMARATGIHLVVATQRPSVDVVTGLIKANFPARISFAVTSQVDSRVILDMPGAEKLLGHGDMLYLPPDAASPIRLQGCFVSDEELETLVHYWVSQTRQEEETAAPEVPWKDIEVILPEEGADELLPQAIALAREHDQLSASFLQRKFRIGYNRAARLVDELEARGVVGPAQRGGRPRDVLHAAKKEATVAVEPLSRDEKEEKGMGEKSPATEPAEMLETTSGDDAPPSPEEEDKSVEAASPPGWVARWWDEAEDSGADD